MRGAVTLVIVSSLVLSASCRKDGSSTEPAANEEEIAIIEPQNGIGPEVTPVQQEAPKVQIQPPVPSQPVPLPQQQAVAPQAPRIPLPDLRLLLTANDVAAIAGTKVSFHRAALAGQLSDEDYDSLYWAPDKGNDFGFAIQVFRNRDMEACRERFSNMMASYPSATEVTPVAGKTFFAYWDEILFVGFILPGKNFIFVVSCGRKFCDSEKLYELAKKIASRSS